MVFTKVGPNPVDLVQYSVLVQVGQLEGGVKFLVNLRADLLAYMRQVKEEKDLAALRLMNSSLQVWQFVGHPLKTH